jgi:hypothetical protein
MNKTPEQHNTASLPALARPVVAPGMGQRRLPYLFAGMEGCAVAALLIGLADVHFLDVGAPLLPLWAVFALAVGACWCERLLQHGRRRLPGAWINSACLLIAAAVFAALAVPWLIDLDAIHAIAAFMLFVFLCYRGFHIAERENDPAYATRTLGLGLGALVIAIFLQLIGPAAGAAPYRYGDLFLLLFALIFLFLLLMARSLSHLAFVRQGHRVEQDDDAISARAQERAMVRMAVVLSLFFFTVALASASLVSPGLLAHMQQFVDAGYLWGTHAFATVIALILSPIVWLLGAIHLKTPAPQSTNIGRIGASHPHGGVYRVPSAPAGSTLTFAAVFEIALLIALILLITALFVWLVQRALRQRTHEPMEERESIWSWPHFWTYMRTFWQALFARLRRKDGGRQTSADAIALEIVPLALSVRDIRAIYHALLWKAARRGYPRQRGETPFEFEQRLEQQLPAVKLHLETITAIYVAARYGGYEPGETEVGRVRDLWLQLERDWQA